MNDFLGTLTGKEQNESCFPSLSFKERIIGFLICFAVGLIIQFFSVGSLMGLAFGKVSKFAFLYTLGNIVSLTGTFFLVGPQRQYKNMVDPSRRNCSLVFIGALIMTLISVYVFHSTLLTILCVIIQFCSYIWYVLSYIPYGRDLARRMLGGLIPGRS